MNKTEKSYQMAYIKIIPPDGFELDEDSPASEMRFRPVKKKDIPEFVIPKRTSVASRLPYRVQGVENGFIQVYCPWSNNGGKIAQIQESDCEPCTENVYTDRLKKIAFEKFGEIKEGDRFIEPSGKIDYPTTSIKEWDYFKQNDQLFFHDLIVYKQGKWAERVEFVKGYFEDEELSYNFYSKILDSEENRILTNHGWYDKNQLDPSTEQLYKTYLEKTAFERFGKIKNGDMFDRTGFKKHAPLANDIVTISDEYLNEGEIGFRYNKNIDSLLYKGFIIYQQGKWAERVNKRVEVRLTGHPTWTPNDAFGYNFCFHFKVKNGGENMETYKAGQFLASQLEKYLNGELEENKKL